MPSGLYDNARDKFLNGDLDWVADTVRAAFVDASYVADLGTHEFFSEVTGVIGTTTLANKTSMAGVADADDVVSGNLASGSTITQVVLYRETGSAATSDLIALFDISAAPKQTNGGTITIQWPTVNPKIFKL